MIKRTKQQEALHEVDPLIPILNLVCMLIPLLVFGAVFVSYHTIEVSQPEVASLPPTVEPRDSLHLTVMITDEGFHFKVNPQYRLPWMAQASPASGSGPDIPKQDDGYDYKALRKRLIEIKDRYPKEQSIILGAEDDVAYDVIIKTMDASRGIEKALFPLVQLTRGIG
jgi:biopolymer transport protein ExbD